jgi:DNA-binding Lrp family transcriptional regulator
MSPTNKTRKQAKYSALDRIDCGIVDALQLDARLSNKELAAKVGLAPSSCLERVRRLEKRGVLQGFRAEVDAKALGINLQALAAVRLSQHKSASFEGFLEHARQLRETVAVYQVAGPDDFLIHVAVRDTEHLRDLVLDHISAHDDVVHIETSLIFKAVRTPTLPNYNADE